MKTQISRNSLQLQQRYSGVYQQQGRMITDADWNELSDLDKQRVWAALLDAVKSGAPRQDGFRINADKTLQPGTLYVNGIPAKLLGNAPIVFTDQSDFPQAPTLPAMNYTLYADVWDRTVTALEDTGLVDAGLHGADTCTRTQTLLQVKWCGAAVNPENPGANPTQGNAELKLKLRQILAGGDACDPCASEIDVNAKAGNYLFRVETHDVYAQGGNQILVLKWSRDNGAEQFKVDNVPLDFQQGDWIYEFFDNTTEKNLGVHLSTGFTPKRGELLDSYLVPTLLSKPKAYVRQWDGYCVLNLTTATLVAGKDKGVALSTVTSVDAQGRVTLSAASFKVNLDLLELELSLAGKVFVTGDFWQAKVREALHHAGDYVLGTLALGITPIGVRHHYLRLAGVDAAGVVVLSTDAEKRRFNFPPLTDIKASDVGFTNTCPSLFGTAENVQQALTALCGIAAEDIAYSLPVCAITPSVATLIGTAPWPDVDGDTKVTVKDMLDALLCRLNASRLPHVVADCGTAALPSVRSLLNIPAGAANAGQILDALLCTMNAKHIPFVKTPASACTELNAPTVLSVQDALEVLCRKSSSGCSATVGVGGQFVTLQSAFTTYMLAGAPQDMLLCLLPGEHIVPADFAITGKRSIKISGSGVSASVIRFQGGLLRFQSQEIQMDDFTVIFSQESGRTILESANVSVEDCVFQRVGKAPGGGALVMVVTAAAGGSVHFENNTLQSAWQRVVPGTDSATIIPSVIGNLEIQKGFNKLLSDEMLGMNSQALDLEISKLAEEIVKLPVGPRTTWSNTTKNMTRKKLIPTSGPTPDLIGFESAPKFSRMGNIVAIDGLDRHDSDPTFSETMLKSAVTVDEVKAALGDLIFAIWETGYSYALALWSHKVGGDMVNNEILGEVVVLNNGNFGPDLGKENVVQVVQGGPVNPMGAKMNLTGNHIVRFSIWAPSTVFDPDDNGRLWAPVPCYSLLNLNQNEFDEDENAFLGGVIHMQGNHFYAAPSSTTATILANQFTAYGNSAGGGVPLRYRSNQTAFAGNIALLSIIS